ncbi:MAG: formate C-acetyltransferase [Lachnospiraceae bacterium]|nr:formate C-acetyltransferase [Lachnospiraceae bacterium]
MMPEWAGFTDGKWVQEINLRDFIQKNYKPYEGDKDFLAGPTQATTDLWNQVLELSKQERENGGVIDMDTKVPSTITSHAAAYLNKETETIVGFQTDKPLKRAFMPFGGIRTAVTACKSYGYEVDPEIINVFTNWRKTHNQGVFEIYTPEMRAARHAHIITGLPDAYGRGRIIGDYRRVALYGVDRLIEDKIAQHASVVGDMTEEYCKLREELADQISALKELKKLGEIYGFDISKPATDVKEAIQWTYFGYLAAVKEQNGAAMSLGRTSTFLDIYAERDLAAGKYTEEQIQEFIDHFIMKLRMVRFARIPEYNALFAGDPTWVTEVLGGMGIDGRSMVTKMSYRYLHTLDNLGTSPEPNMTVLWSTKLPENWKRYCAEMSIKSSSIQYENDDMMRVTHGDDYAIACCVSSMRVGKEMQFFGARANLAKCLLYAINGGVDEKELTQIGPKYRPITSEYLDYDEVQEKFHAMMEWLAGLYVQTLNAIHYMHDKYCYEKLQMALHDRDVTRWFATGIAGLSVVADSLSAIKYAKVKCIRNEQGIVVDYEIEGDFPKYGNNDDRVDQLAVDLVDDFMNMIRKHPTYRKAIPTTSILTITSNVAYGKNTGSTPDGRKAGVPLAPGANPMHGRDENGALASLSSVAKLPFSNAQDGISNTFTILPDALGKDGTFTVLGDMDIELTDEQIKNAEGGCGCC